MEYPMNFYYKKSRAVMLFGLLAFLTVVVAVMVLVERFHIYSLLVLALLVLLYYSFWKHIRRGIMIFRNVPCLTLYSDRLLADPELLGGERRVLIRFDEIEDIDCDYDDYCTMNVRCSDPRPFYASNRNALEFISQIKGFEELVFIMPLSGVAGGWKYAFYSIRDTFYDYYDKAHQT